MSNAVSSRSKIILIIKAFNNKYSNAEVLYTCLTAVACRNSKDIKVVIECNRERTSDLKKVFECLDKSILSDFSNYIITDSFNINNANADIIFSLEPGDTVANNIFDLIYQCYTPGEHRMTVENNHKFYGDDIDITAEERRLISLIREMQARSTNSTNPYATSVVLLNNECPRDIQ